MDRIIITLVDAVGIAICSEGALFSAQQNIHASVCVMTTRSGLLS
jgi:hypothetical protein